MKIIPHPAVLKEKEAELNRVQDHLMQKATDLHVLEAVVRSQKLINERAEINRKINYLYFFLAGLVSGFSLALVFFI